MKLGKVMWFSRKKGFGFIKSEDGEEYFVHVNNIIMDGITKLVPGENVNFEIAELDNNRREAINVSSLDA